MKAAIGRHGAPPEIQKAYNERHGIEPEDDQQSRHPHAEAKGLIDRQEEGRRPGGTARPGRARTSSPTSRPR